MKPPKYITFMASGSDEMAQPWARQSLVQLAPVWGRITDPQTVQTTTSVQSERWLATIQQQVFRVRASGPTIAHVAMK